MTIKVAKRDNNPKRNFVLVNTTMSKHIPTNPKETKEMCCDLAYKIKEIVGNRRVLLIAFAETATAVGGLISKILPNSYFITTTREVYKGEKSLQFLEEHSHAMEQTLYIGDLQRRNLLKDFNCVVFVDDEFTTGKTILNFMEVLKRVVKEDSLFVASSFLMADVAEKNLTAHGMKIAYLEKVENKDYTKEFPETFIEDTVVSEDTAICCFKRSILSRINQRIGAESTEYNADMWEMVETTYNSIKRLIKDYKTIRVMSTEEYTHLAIELGEKLMDAANKKVVVHSVTRSPILPSDDEDYVIHSRVKLKSLYDRDRTVYMYNTMDKVTDLAILVTDAKITGYSERLEEMCRALNSENVLILNVRR